MEMTRQMLLDAEELLGAFWTDVSSSSCGVPVIVADLAVSDCFMGIENVPSDVCHMLGRGDPGAAERLMGLAKTIPATNVTFQIDLGYAFPPPDALKRAAERRSDNRIAIDVEKLVARRKK